MSRPSKHKGSDALEYLWKKYYANDPKAQSDLSAAKENALIASQIYAAREKNNLTQKQLAELVGTATSVICQLEDADYEGHSLRMLRKIATALNMRIVLAFLEEDQQFLLKKVRKKRPVSAGRKKGREVVLNK